MLPSVTYQEFITFGHCWLENEDQAQKLQEIGMRQKIWTALDVLNLPCEDISAKDKLWAVLREDFIPAPILHEFACRCAEHALSRIKNPDPRSVAAIAAKRAWLKGEIDNAGLDRARAAAGAAARSAAWATARSAAGYAALDAARSAALDAARSAAWATAGATAGATARDAAWYAALDAARSAAWATAGATAGDAAWDAAWDAALDAARDAEKSWQVETLRNILQESDAAAFVGQCTWA